MAAIRLFDVANCKISGTQVVGIETIDGNFGFRTVQTNTDAGFGAAARDRLAHFVDLRLAGEDIAQFPTLIALFEAAGAAAGLVVLANGKTVGAATGYLMTANRMKLVAANLDFRQGAYCKSTFDLRNSAAAASTSSDDEINLSVADPLTITHSSNLRGLRIISAAFTPHGLSAITPAGVMGLSLAIRWPNDTTFGDADFGETVDVGGWELTGSLEFKDITLVGTESIAQELYAALYGTLVITYKEQVNETQKTLTINNLAFEADRQSMAANRMHSNSLSFGCFSQVGADWYTIGTGANKILTVA